MLVTVRQEVSDSLTFLPIDEIAQPAKAPAAPAALLTKVLCPGVGGDNDARMGFSPSG